VRFDQRRTPLSFLPNAGKANNAIAACTEEICRFTHATHTAILARRNDPPKVILAAPYEAVYHIDIAVAGVLPFRSDKIFIRTRDIPVSVWRVVSEFL